MMLDNLSPKKSLYSDTCLKLGLLDYVHTPSKWCILVMRSANVMGNIAGKAWEGRHSAVPRGKIFLKQGPKQGILVLF